MSTKSPSNLEPMTLQQIADSEGVSPQCIAEILERAIRKALKRLQARGIKPDDVL